MKSDNAKKGTTQDNRQVEIRAMRIEDLPGVFHLGETLFTLRKSPSLYRTWDEFEVLDCYRSDPEACLVALKNAKLVGFIIGTIVDKRDSPRKYGYLVWLGVEAEFEDTGVGTRLFEEFKSLMKKKGVRMILVDTQADNERALNFFKARGFSTPLEHVYLSLNLVDE